MTMNGRRGAAGDGGLAAELDHKLTLSLPPPVVRQLRARMAAEETTFRALVLEALRQAGYAVPVEEIRDRRRGAAGEPIAGEEAPVLSPPAPERAAPRAMLLRTGPRRAAGRIR